MVKRMIKAILHGAVAGVALNAVAALAVSYWLRLGYYMPCLATLPEQVGGELNGALFQMSVAAAAGAASGILWKCCMSRVKHCVDNAGVETVGGRRARRSTHAQRTGVILHNRGTSAVSCEALALKIPTASRPTPAGAKSSQP